MIADGWSRHVCDQQVRGSSSYHPKCQQNWHLQFTRYTLDRSRRASAWVGSSMESTIDCGRLVTPNVRPASPRQQQLPVQVHDELALTVHAVYARLIASERVGGLKYGAHYCWRTTGHSTCATNKSEAAAAAVPKVHDELALTVHAVYARPKTSERVGRLKHGAHY